MALVECAICGKRVNTEKKNCTLIDGKPCHKKCPKGGKLNDKEKEDLKNLKTAIEWASVNKNLSDYGLNWALISRQIKELKDEGYSYQDQLYALKYVVEKDGGYWGYGRIKKFIAHAMQQKKREEEYEARKYFEELEERKREQETKINIKVKSKPTFLEM